MEDKAKKFLKITQTGSFTKASKELRISQPALSTAVAKLEKQLGTELFYRGQTPIKLTPAGQLVVDYALKLDLNTQNFELNLSRLLNKKPRLAIGMIDSIAEALISQNRLLDDLESLYELNLSVNNSRFLLDRLRLNKLDLAVAVKPQTVVSSEFTMVKLGSEPLVGVVRADLADKTLKSIDAGRIANFLSYDQQSNTSRMISDYFLANNLECNTVFYSTSPEIIMHMVLSGKGMAVLPYDLLLKRVDRQKLVFVTQPIGRPIVLIKRTSKKIPDISAELTETVRKLLKTNNARLKREQKISGVV